MPEIHRLEKRLGLHLACFSSAAVDSKRNSPASTPKSATKCESRVSAGGVADEWVTQLLRQGDAKVFKKYSQMKLQMKREALTKIHRLANETGPSFGTVRPN